MVTTERLKFGIRKNDQVQVMSGREKGKTGKVITINRKSGRITIEKVNLVKRHMKPTQMSPQGGIIEKELPLHYSNVLLMCGKCNRGVRHGHKVSEAKGKGAETKATKVRVCKRCGGTLEVAGT
jgi:large subunit ribosomal protein L24